MPGLVDETEAILHFDELRSDTYVNLVGQLEPGRVHRRVQGDRSPPAP
jgi:hypothetical protein